MNSLRPFKSNNYNHYHLPSYSNHSKLHQKKIIPFHTPNYNCKNNNVGHVKKQLVVRACNVKEEDGNEENIRVERPTFLSLQEAGLVEISGLSTHERFLCRLTISSLNLLRVVAEQEGCSIEELNAGRVCDWFLKDKLKREQNLGSAVLQWDEHDPFDFQF